MILPSLTSSEHLHPLIEGMVDLIRLRRLELPELNILSVDPILKDIRSSVDGEAVSIKNELHICKGLRKIHLEVAKLDSGLEILHCVFFPDPRYDLPIFGADVVVCSTAVSAAIVDLSPVAPDLPLSILKYLQKLPSNKFTHERELPSWGSIFSDYVKFVRPVSKAEEDAFLSVVDSYLKALIESVLTTKPEQEYGTNTLKRKQSQIDYCYHQKLNDKTRGALIRAFNEEWADRYINEILFDCT